MEPEVVFEDEALMVLSKPAGWITNDATTTGTQPTVQQWLRRNFKFQISNLKLYRNGIVHRLDKETSGAPLIAKTKEAFENLQAQFKNRIVEKKYIALVHGEVEPKEGSIDISVGRLPWRRDRFGVLPGGRDATTEYKVLNYYLKSDGRSKKAEDRSSNTKFQTSLSNFNSQTSAFTLVDLFPKTGRTHQIRIHMKYLGYPLVADEFYAGRKTARRDRKWCPRLFLHASEISFLHPQSRERVNFKSDLPEDLKSALKTLEMVRENA